MTRTPIDVDVIRALAQVLNDKGLTEIEVDDGTSRIRIARTPTPVVGYIPPAGPVPMPAAALPAAALPVAAAVTAESAGAVLSPMVGVVYLSAEPSTPNFVAVGQSVDAGQTLLLIEAMKTFNQIRAPHAGTVTRILVASGMPVEFGEVLLVIE